MVWIGVSARGNARGWRDSVISGAGLMGMCVCLWVCVATRIDSARYRCGCETLHAALATQEGRSKAPMMEIDVRDRGLV